jgi:anion-transporting  ArsA/GET3 family ATPase
MRKAEELYQIILKGLKILDPTKNYELFLKPAVEAELKEEELEREEEDMEDNEFKDELPTPEEHQKHVQLQHVVEESYTDPIEDPNPEEVDITEGEREGSATEEIDLKTLSSMFERRNQLVSAGTFNQIEEDQKITVETTEELVVIPSPTVSVSLPLVEEDIKLIQFRSVFGSAENEPGITNWSGEFQG